MTYENLAAGAEAVATGAGVVAAIWAGWIALLTYRTQTTRDADAHAHAVIREVLIVEMDASHDRDAVCTFKLYALEEAFDWLTEQRDEVSRWPWSCLARDRAGRLAELRCWNETLKTHLEAVMRDRVNNAPVCYGQGFRDFVMRYAPVK